MYLLLFILAGLLFAALLAWFFARLHPHAPPLVRYEVSNPRKRAEGSRFRTLMECGENFLCPECGGYGTYDYKPCSFCSGKGVLEKDDSRIVEEKPA